MVTPFTDFSHSDGKNDWLIIFTFDREKLFQETINSIRKFEPDLKILVIDNGSEDGTINIISEMLKQNKINRAIFNAKSSIPQWQKCCNLHQAYKLLSMEKVDFLGWIDDDIYVKRPFVQFSKDLLKEFEQENIGIVNFVVDEIQNLNHPIIDKKSFDNVEVFIKETIVGMFVFFNTDLLNEIGLPPIGEGINDLSVEDWFYSRVLKTKGIKVAAVDFADHLGYKTSIRDSIGKK